MDLIERATIIHFHRQRIAQFGLDTVHALGWRGPDSQSARFEVIAQAVDFNDSSVLDVGCGSGELKRFLDPRCRGIRYLGIELVPEFVTLARTHCAGDDNAVFILGDFAALPLPRADHVVASGLLAYRSADPRHLARSIARLYSAALRTLVFNVLDARHYRADALLTGHDVPAVLAFCRQLSAEVTLIEGYAPDDVTVVMAAA
jgi:SAM-dependent methyltransferase